jgi:hypothetical protein
MMNGFYEDNNLFLILSHIKLYITAKTTVITIYKGTSPQDHTSPGFHIKLRKKMAAKCERYIQ